MLMAAPCQPAATLAHVENTCCCTVNSCDEFVKQGYFLAHGSLLLLLLAGGDSVTVLLHVTFNAQSAGMKYWVCFVNKE